MSITKVEGGLEKDITYSPGFPRQPKVETLKQSWVLGYQAGRDEGTSGTDGITREVSGSLVGQGVLFPVRTRGPVVAPVARPSGGAPPVVGPTLNVVTGGV